MKNSKILIISLLILASRTLIFAQAFIDESFNNLLRTENGGWVAGDATYSISLPNGNTLWLFGDSFIGKVNADSSLVPGTKMIRNCAVLQEGNKLFSKYNGTFENPSEFLQTNTPDSTWFWPEHGLVENDTLKIFMSEFGTTEGNPGWNFEFRSTCLAFFTYPELEFITYVKSPYYDINGVMYGDQILVDGDYTYIYGRKEEYGNIPYPHIARTLNGNLLGDWQFFSGVAWLDNPTDTRRMTNDAVSQQFGVVKIQDKYVLITQEIWLGSKIYSFTSSQPEGPWKNQKTLYSTPRPFEDMITYNSFPHPQFNIDNTLLISYNTNGNFADLFTNIELYRPRFIRVPFTEIDTDFSPSSIPQKEKTLFNLTNCFPNPALDKISFSFDLLNSDFIELKIYNVSGVEIIKTNNKQFEKGNNIIEVNITNLPKGAYFYHIKDKKGWFLHN